MHEWGGLTRFASNSIHQSTHREDTGVSVRGSRRTDRRRVDERLHDRERRAADHAGDGECRRARCLVPRARPAGRGPGVDLYDEATASATPAFRADGVADLVAQCPEGFTAAGAFETIASEVAVANTEGQFCWSPSTMASINTVVSGGEGGHGFAEVFESATSDVDPVAIGKRAASKAVDSQSPRDIEAGGIPSCSSPRRFRRSWGSSRGSGSAGGRSPRGAHASARRGTGWPWATSRSTTTRGLAERLAAVRLRGRAAVARRSDQGRDVPRRRLRPSDREAGRGENDGHARSRRRTRRDRSL